MPTDTAIDILSKAYKINTGKPHFPVNTMRLFYLLLVNEITKGNTDALEKTNQVIPKISAILDARDLSLSNKDDKKTPQTQFTTCSKAIENLLKTIDTPEIRQTIQILFSDIYPLQESLLQSIDQYLKQDKLTESDLKATLKIRAMDSILYSSVIDQVAQEFISIEGTRDLVFKSSYVQVNAILQINDLVDAIVYAKQDLASKSATLIEVIKRINPTHSGLENTIRTTVDQLHKTAEFPKEHNCTDFVERLIKVIG